MTREHANRIVNTLWDAKFPKPFVYVSDTSQDNWLVNSLEALGVLKLETNENADMLLAAVKALTGSCVGVTESAFGTGNIPETTAMWIIGELVRKGFKITKE